MKSYLQFPQALRIESLLMINGIDIMNAKYNNKQVRSTFCERRKTTPRGKALCDNISVGTDWQRAWLLPYKFCITSTIKEVHITILHNIYPTNLYFSTFLDIENTCNLLQWWTRIFNALILPLYPSSYFLELNEKYCVKVITILKRLCVTFRKCMLTVTPVAVKSTTVSILLLVLTRVPTP